MTTATPVKQLNHLRRQKEHVNMSNWHDLGILVLTRATSNDFLFFKWFSGRGHRFGKLPVRQNSNARNVSYAPLTAFQLSSVPTFGWSSVSSATSMLQSRARFLEARLAKSWIKPKLSGQFVCRIWDGFSTKTPELQSWKPDERPWFLFV